TMIEVKHREHLSYVVGYISDLGTFDVVLSMPWLEEHDPDVSWKKRSLTFNSEFCSIQCLEHFK
ncbi:hypothetical protein P152DRAFT_376537, partial [Eremomyces bilateralis CBS 781.70]